MYTPRNKSKTPTTRQDDLRRKKKALEKIAKKRQRELEKKKDSR